MEGHAFELASEIRSYINAKFPGARVDPISEDSTENNLTSPFIASLDAYEAWAFALTHGGRAYYVMVEDVTAKEEGE